MELVIVSLSFTIVTFVMTFVGPLIFNVIDYGGFSKEVWSESFTVAWYMVLVCAAMIFGLIFSMFLILVLITAVVSII